MEKYDFSQLQKDKELLEDIVNGSGNYRTMLKQVQESPLEPASVQALIEAGVKLTPAHDICKKYEFGPVSGEDRLGELYSSGVRQIMTYIPTARGLDSVLTQSISAFMGQLTKDFKKLTKKVANSRVEDAVKYREKLNEAANLYMRVNEALGFEANQRYSAYVKPKIRRYAAFVADIAELDNKFRQMAEKYEETRFDSKKNLEQLKSSLSLLAEHYQQTIKRHRPLKIAREHKEYDYKEKIVELRGLDTELNYFIKNYERLQRVRRDIMSGISSAGEISDTLDKLKLSGNPGSAGMLESLGRKLQHHSEKYVKYKANLAADQFNRKLFGENLEKYGAACQKATAILEGRSQELIEVSRKKKKDADYWNNKFPISDEIVYHARDSRMWDVRDFIQADNTILKDIVQREGLEGKTLDETAYRCMRWVQENIAYTHDPQFTGHLEEWLFPSESVQIRSGDCEDGTNLMVSLMRNAGVDAYRVKNTCGIVDGGGHSWPLYLRESDDKWVILDWCYKQTKKPVKKRELAKHRKDYREIWFAFNDEHSWTEGPLAINKDYLTKEKVKKPEQEHNVIAIQGEGNGSFVLSDYLTKSPQPSTYHLLKLRDILEGRTGLENLFDRLNQFSDYLVTMKPVTSARDKEFLRYLSHGLEQEMSNGSISRLMGASTYRKSIVNDTLSQFKKYLMAA